jgi:hypothetical protein
MIKIISGTYGHLIGGRVRPKTAASEPFSLPPEQEARLVSRGVAIYVNEAPAEADASNSFDHTPDEEPAAEPVGKGYDIGMTAKELREIGASYGLTFKQGISKAEMVEKLDALFADLDLAETEQGEEEAPTFDATEAVQ